NSASQHMVKLTGGSNWTFRNAEVWGARSFAGILVTSGPSNWRITGNCIHDTYPSNSTNQDHNIYVNSGLSAGPGSIDHNILFNATNGRNVKLGAPSIGDANGTQNVTIAWNTMVNASQNVSISGSSRNNTVEHNLIVKSAENRLIYGYSLAGTGNVARDNLGFAASNLIDGTNITDGGGNVFPRDPKFDGTASCDAFHPADPVAAAFGARAGDAADVATPAPAATASAPASATASPTPEPTTAPTATPAPTASPTPDPTPVPTATPAPTASPTEAPTTRPTGISRTTGSPITLRAVAASGNASTSSLTLRRPSGTVEGDQLIAAVTLRGGTAPRVSAPAGWTLVRTDAVSTTIAQSVYRHRATAGDPASWTWTFSKKEAAAGTIGAFDGVDPTDPIGADTGSSNTKSSTSIATVAATAPRAGSLLVAIFGIARATSISAGGGMANAIEASSSGGSRLAASALATLALVSDGRTPNPAALATLAAVSIGQLIVLNPAP
ncbi:MAG TPA: hypothetical protein VFR93_01575, partial [Candidatus Limnocylindrales bacterium]|nr:hypothetical protein [Candidatus Limnocylindrales bacterium]